MSAFNQNNVKGWTGGRHWLSTQLLKRRERLIDFMIVGNKTYERIINNMLSNRDGSKISFEPKIQLKDMSNGAKISTELVDKLIFKSNDEIDLQLFQILDYEFDGMSQSTQKQTLLAYQYLAKTAEFQII